MAEEVPLPDVKPVIRSIKSKFPESKDQLIPMLQYVQTELGYLPSEAMKGIAECLKVPVSHVYGVATFYAQFRFKPLGKNRITVCRGTACHVRGSGRLVEDLERELGIKPGDTTPDLEFSVETVACIGSCALAPVEVVNDRVYGKMTPKKQKSVLEELKGGAPQAEEKEEPEKKPAAAKKPEQGARRAAGKKPAKKKEPSRQKPAKRAASKGGKKTVKKSPQKTTAKAPAKKTARKKAVKKAAKKKAAKKRAARKTVKKSAAKKSKAKKAGKRAKKSPAGKSRK